MYSHYDGRQIDMVNSRDDYDVVIIGAGHNGLVCAYYLAEKGLKVRVLESRHVVGGAAVTEEFHPGFRNSVAAYTVSLLNPGVIQDMALESYGLKIIERPADNFLPLDNNQYLLLSGDLSRRQRAFARFSQKDAAALPRYQRQLDKVAAVLRSLVLKPPPDINGGLRSLGRALSLGWKVHSVDVETQRDLLDFFSISAADYLDRYFESEAVKALFRFDSIVGNYASPYSPGSAYVLLHHVFGEVNGKKGAWGHAMGGMGAITQAMAKACESCHVEISLESPVTQVLVENGRTCGVALEDGRHISASCVASNINPLLLYQKLIDAAELPEAFLERISHWKCASGTFRMNVALSELPDFTCLPGREPALHHSAGIIMAPSLDYMDQAYLDACAGGWSKQPVVEMLIPSTLDDTLAPAGRHVASLFCQHFAPELPDKQSWDEVKDVVADHIIDHVTTFAPNFREAVLGRMVLSPLDLERKFGLVGGDIFHGALSLNQLFSARPMLGYAQYRGPVRGLYMCGSGTHPGGGVTGAPGHNAAKQILRTVRK